MSASLFGIRLEIGFAYLCTCVVYLCKHGRTLRAVLSICPAKDPSNAMKYQRHNAIRELVANSLVSNQDELRRKLRRRGFEVTQATLSRDIHELRISKGPGGYSLPNGNGNGGTAVAEDERPPSVAEVLEGFGLRVRQAMNQVILRTVMGGAQPVAAALDYEGWPEVVGTIAGDDTVLVICQDQRHASEVEQRLRKILES
jgi:transcriptional regulator of arginine metabolism